MFKVVISSFQGHNGNVTAAVFNANSSHIASGSDKGEIILSNISTKESSAPLLAPRVQVSHYSLQHLQLGSSFQLLGFFF